MADLVEIVTRSAGGRPVVVLPIDESAGYIRERGTFKYTPPEAVQQISQSGRRYGGGRVVGETHGNAQVSWRQMIKGSTHDQAAERVEAMLQQIAAAASGRWLAWRPEGLSPSRSSFMQIVGPGSWDPGYQWVEWMGAMVMPVTVTFPVLPLPEWAPMTIRDDFSVDSLSDYTFDALTSSSVVITGGSATPNGSLTSERRARHTARGYDTLGGQRTQKYTPGATITSFKGAVTLRASASNTYVEVYVDDNGTNSRLRIDVVIAGARTNRASTNLAARISNGTPFWIRGRIENGVVTAEHFTAAPTPMGAPTTTTSYTLAGGDAPLNTTGGKTGFAWTPQHASATMDDYHFCPYVRRNVTLPEKIQLDDAIPGTAPAKAAITVTPSGGSSPPVWALLAWATRASTPLAGAVVPFGVLEAETAGDLTGWSSAADGGARGGNRLIDTSVSGAETYTASWTIDPHTLVGDDFTQGELDIELWARVVIGAGLVLPRLTLSARPADGLNFGSERFSHEHGSVGKLLVKPSTGNTYRPTRLGTVTLPVDPLRPSAWKLWLAGATATGSTGQFGVDYLIPVLRRARALSPTGKANDAAYPDFVASTNQTQKTIREDLSGLVGSPPNNPYPDHGLGGSPIHIPGGSADVIVKLSSLVPDDPTSLAGDEQLAHSAAIELDVTPRSHMLRSA